MSSIAKNGFLVVADISGYTRFLADTELEHANGILKDLFDSIIPVFERSIEISNFMGDAILGHCDNRAMLNTQFIIDFAKEVYNSFADKKELININTSCQCSACKHMSELDLKVFVHYGEYINQKLQDRNELAGSDVNSIFRLMKNDVVEKTEIEPYLLVTKKALDAMGISGFGVGKHNLSQNYEHIGKIEFVIDDLHQYWEAHRQVKRHYIDSSDRLLFDEISVKANATSDLAFLMYTKPEWRQRIMHADKIEIFNKNSSTLGEGTSFHCHHGDEVFKMEITDWQSGKYVSLKHLLPFDMVVRETTEFVSENGSCIIKTRMSEIETPNLISKILVGFIRKKIRLTMFEGFNSVLNSMVQLADELAETKKQ
jgi:hypothetical protein